jgi:hypothetical protein
VELVKIFLTSGLTIVGDVLVFVLGQVIQKSLLDPVHEQSKAIGEIYFGLVYDAIWCASHGSGKPEDMAAGVRRNTPLCQSAPRHNPPYPWL